MCTHREHVEEEVAARQLHVDPHLKDEEEQCNNDMRKEAPFNSCDRDGGSFRLCGDRNSDRAHSSFTQSEEGITSSLCDAAQQMETTVTKGCVHTAG